MPTPTEVREADWPQIFQDLETTADGLSTAEAAERLQRYGPNEIKEKSPNPIIAFLAFFWGPIPWMIEVAAILAAVITTGRPLIIIAMLPRPGPCIRRSKKSCLIWFGYSVQDAGAGFTLSEQGD